MYLQFIHAFWMLRPSYTKWFDHPHNSLPSVTLQIMKTLLLRNSGATSSLLCTNILPVSPSHLLNIRYSLWGSDDYHIHRTVRVALQLCSHEVSKSTRTLDRLSTLVTLNGLRPRFPGLSLLHHKYATLKLITEGLQTFPTLLIYTYRLFIIILVFQCFMEITSWNNITLALLELTAYPAIGSEAVASCVEDYRGKYETF